MLYRDKKNEKINGAYVYAYLCIMNDYSMCCNVSRCVCVHRRSNDPDYYDPDYCVLLIIQGMQKYANNA